MTRPAATALPIASFLPRCGGGTADSAGMNIAIFGLAVSSSWGNGHAALWRGLIARAGGAGPRGDFLRARRALLRREPRPARTAAPSRLVLYADWAELRPDAARALADADVGIVTSYCPDAIAATALLLDSRVGAALLLRPRYAGDARPAGARRARGLSARDGLADFDLVLSYTGGAGARRAAQRARRAPRGAALRLGRSGAAPAGLARPALPGRTLLYRHLRRRPADGAGAAAGRARAGAAGRRGSSSPARSIRRIFPGRRTSGSSATCRRPSIRPSIRPRA